MSPSDDVILPVHRQLEAYNARDIEAFMPWWAADCRLYAFPDQLLAAGTAAIRARHVERFREPNLHGRLLNRTAVGNLVVDREVVSRTFPDGPGEVDVLAFYEVERGLIVRAWFRTGEPRRLPDGPLVLRRAGPADAGAVRDLTRAAYARWVPVVGREPLPMAADYEAAVRKHRIDLLGRGEAIAALIELVPGADQLLILNLAVDPGQQGGGLGRRLLVHAEQVAAAAGLPRITLYTNALFAGNVRFYQGRGYAVDREERSALGTIVHMSKPVSPAG